MTFVITTLTAYIAVGPDGEEGVCAFRQQDGGWVPLVGADAKRIESLRPLAESIARESERTIKLARFSVREDLEEIKPR